MFSLSWCCGRECCFCRFFSVLVASEFFPPSFLLFLLGRVFLRFPFFCCLYLKFYLCLLLCSPCSPPCPPRENWTRTPGAICGGRSGRASGRPHPLQDRWEEGQPAGEHGPISRTLGRTCPLARIHPPAYKPSQVVAMEWVCVSRPPAPATLLYHADRR